MKTTASKEIIFYFAPLEKQNVTALNWEALKTTKF